MEHKARNIAIFHSIASIAAFIYHIVPFYPIFISPFLLASIALAATSRFKPAFTSGVIWLAVFSAIMIPMYLFSFSNLNSYRYYEAFFNYLTLGWVFYSFVCVSTALLYKNRAVVPVKPNKKQGMIVGSEASHYCRYCGAEIKEGETTCLNCDSSLTET